MIIKVTGADYSACGLGKVEIPIVIGNKVKKIFSYFSSHNEIGNQNELQRFFNSVASFEEKIKVLCLPCFASTSHEAVLNVITNKITTDAEPGSFIEIDSSRSTKISNSYSGNNFMNIVTKYNTDYASEVKNASSAMFISFKSNFKISLYGIDIDEGSAAVGILPTITETETFGLVCDEEAKLSYIGDERKFNDKFNFSNVNANANLYQSYQFCNTNNKKGCTIFCLTSGMTDEEYVVLHKAMTTLNKNFK